MEALESYPGLDPLRFERLEHTRLYFSKHNGKVSEALISGLSPLKQQLLAIGREGMEGRSQESNYCSWGQTRWQRRLRW